MFIPYNVAGIEIYGGATFSKAGVSGQKIASARKKPENILFTNNDHVKS